MTVPQRSKTQSQDRDVPGGPSWELALVSEGTRALPAPEHGIPACFSHPIEGPPPGSGQSVEDCC